MAHELGHNHGQEHAPCGVSPADAAFPYSGGAIGVWGLDRRSATLKDPAKIKDIMSYCTPQWASDYTYEAFLKHVAAVNGVTAASEVTAAEAEQPWRVMLLSDQGARWGIPIPDPEPPEGEPKTARIYDASGAWIQDVTVYYISMSLPGSYTVLVPEPEPGWSSVRLEGGQELAFE